MQFRFLLPICTVVLLFAACAPVPELRNEAFLSDTSLILGQPCEAPCWREIIPGETTLEEAIQIIRADEQLTNLDEQRDDSGRVAVNFNAADGPQCCRIFSQDGEIVTSVLTFLKPELTLNEVLDRFGEPQYIQAESFTVDQTFITFAYPDVPMLIYVFAEAFETATLSPDNQVIGVVYLAADEMDVIIETSNWYAWQDYGLVQQIFDEEFDLTAVPTTATTE